MMKLGMIGAGNMAGAIVKGVIQAGTLNPKDIWISDVSTARAGEYTDLGVHFTADNREVFAHTDLWVLAVKPNIYPVVLQEASKVEDISNKIIVTIAAGITIQTVQSYSDKAVKVIRTMPNTPAIVGEGMTMISYEPPVTDEDYETAKSIFDAVGKTALLPEKLMNAAVALNGSSPAYIYMLIEAMADGAVCGGIPRDLAYKAAAQTVLGSAKMVLKTGLHPGTLKDMVCTPGGTTIEAVRVLEQSGFRGGIMAAMEACGEKAEELGR